MKTRGFALILVLWVLVLLSIVASSFSSTVRVETRSGSWASDSTILEALAIAAINRSAMALSSPDPNLRWRTDGRVNDFRLNGRLVQIRLRNEGGKVDINFAPRAILEELFQLLAPDANPNALVDALIDWRDRDSQASPQGAEARDYLAAGFNYVPANAPLSSVDELSLVKGFNNDVIERLRSSITVYSRQPKIDISAAPVQVIAALPGISLIQAEEFVSSRDAAQEAEEVVDMTLLAVARPYIVNFPASSLVEIELEIEQDGYRHREAAVVRLQSADGNVEILARRTLADEQEEE